MKLFEETKQVLQKDLRSFQAASVIIKLAVVLYSLFFILSASFVAFKIYDFNKNILLASLSIIVILLLGYIAVFDIFNFEVPGNLTLFLPLILAILNIIYLIYRSPDQVITFWNENTTTAQSNIIAGLIGGVVILVIVLITKEKGMGAGDIRILSIIGFSLGLEKLLLAFYFSIISALIFSLPIIIYKRRIKNIEIPFVPFLVLGGILALILNLDISSLLIS